MTEHSPAGPKPHFQFTLRQLLGAMAIACIAAAAVYWLGPGPALVAIVFFAFIGVAIFFAAKRRYTEAAFTIFVGIGISLLLLPAISGARVNYRWAACQNSMRNIALALQMYESDYGTFPPAYIADANGKPMHSWRVLLLPYLDQRNLYKLYRFDEPWDGPNNSQLHGTILKIYFCPSEKNYGPGTSYLAVTGPQTIWPGAKSTKMSDIKDGPGNTILVVEVHNSGIHWMEPRDLDFATMRMTVNSVHQHHATSLTSPLPMATFKPFRRPLPPSLSAPPSPSLAAKKTASRP